MKKNHSKAALIAIIVLLAALMAGAAALYPKMSAQVAQMNATPAPTATPEATTAPEATATPTPEVAGPVQRFMAADFAVYADDGTPVRLSGLRGKPVVVNFFASWCGPCKYEMPYFEEMYRLYGDKVEFLMVNLCAYGNDSKDAAKKMIADGGYTFPVFYDTEGEAMNAYAVNSMPTTLFVSEKGELKGRKIGMIDEATLRATVEAMAAEAVK